MQTKRLLFIFIPALLVVGIAFFIRFTQYEPLLPDFEEVEKQREEASAFKIPVLREDPVVGNRRANITLIAFEDFGCEACDNQSRLIAQLITKHPENVKLVWKGLPVTRIPYNSRDAHLMSHCMHKQDLFDEFADRAFANRLDLSPSVLDAIATQMSGVNQNSLRNCMQTNEASDHLQRTEQLAKALDIQSVPTIFLDNKQIQHPQSVEGWENFLGL